MTDPPADGWDGAGYQRVARPQAAWAGTVAERVPVDGVRRVLDAGCGSGIGTALLLDRLAGARVVALDASADMLREARERLAAYGDRVEFVRADLDGPLPPLEPVDVVFSTAVFHWVADHERLFASLAGLLRPGGWLVAQWGGEGNLRRVIGALRGAGRAADDRWRFTGVADAHRLLAGAGFVGVEAWTHPEPARFADRSSFVDFVATVILADQPDRPGDVERRRLAEAVADALPDLTLDYVRIDVAASVSG